MVFDIPRVSVFDYFHLHIKYFTYFLHRSRPIILIHYARVIVPNLWFMTQTWAMIHDIISKTKNLKINQEMNRNE